MSVTGASTASEEGPCSARSPTSSEMFLSRMLAPPFCFTTCAQSLSMFAAFTTIITLSSNR